MVGGKGGMGCDDGDPESGRHIGSRAHALSPTHAMHAALMQVCHRLIALQRCDDTGVLHQGGTQLGESSSCA